MSTCALVARVPRPGTTVQVIALALCVACGDDAMATTAPEDAGQAGADAGPPVGTDDARAPRGRDAGGRTNVDAAVHDAQGVRPMAESDAAPDGSDRGGPDASVDGSARSVDAGVPSVPASEIAAILASRCGGCHQNRSSDGFLFDGRLRTTLFDPVEAPPTLEGDPPGASACRTEPRVLRGEVNSYLLRKVELGLGQQPDPPVCGAGMPLDTALDDAERRELTQELERLRRWVAGGAPLE